jgi:sugar/nucleoside kinase (ribokinase family)
MAMNDQGPNAKRAAIASAAAGALERAAAAGSLERTPALAGFDGFLDSIIRVVDRRRSMALEDFEPIRTIPGFAGRVAGAAGKSANIELVVDEVRFGGNGPLYAGALGRLGVPTEYIGAVGREEVDSALHPAYEPLAERCRRVTPIAPPALTDALEFDDGKIMLGKPANVQAVTWDRLRDRVGLDALRGAVSRCRLLGIVNWTLCGGVQGIWEGLIEHVLADLPHAGSTEAAEGRRVFIDLSDPAKRTDADLATALATLKRMNELVPVTLSLNLAEGERVAGVLGVEAFTDAPSLGESVRIASERVRERSGLACVVIHPREGAGAAEEGGESAWFEGPFTAHPRLSTGAGDHFGAGFSFAQVLGLPLDQSLAVGCGVSGAYVRDASSPNLGRLVSFLRGLPGPERAGD